MKSVRNFIFVVISYTVNVEIIFSWNTFTEAFKHLLDVLEKINPLICNVQNGRAHFKHLAAFAARCLKCIWPFLYIVFKSLNGLTLGMPLSKSEDKIILKLQFNTNVSINGTTPQVDMKWFIDCQWFGVVVPQYKSIFQLCSK